MSVMKRVSRRHNFRVLLHEKPFNGVNGTGKHCNWSMGTDKGVNLFSPGKDREDNSTLHHLRGEHCHGRLEIQRFIKSEYRFRHERTPPRCERGTSRYHLHFPRNANQRDLG